MFDDSFMQRALMQAKAASVRAEVPVGAVLVQRTSGTIVSEAHNCMIGKCNPLMHAELLVINEAFSVLDEKFLNNYDLYVTLEPCPMCMTAISYARVGRVFYAAARNDLSRRYPFVVSAEYLSYKPEIYGGIKETQSETLLRDFFQYLRKKASA